MREYLLIIDVQFLIEARNVVQEIYESVYSDPEDNFYKPKKYNDKISLSQFISECDYYAGFGEKFNPKTYVIGSNYTQLANTFEVNDLNNSDANKLFANNYPWNEAEQIIQINRDMNVLLVADNQFYSKMIEENSSDRDIQLIRYKYDLRRNAISLMSNQFRYQDIIYPLGICLGLNRDEL